MWQNALARWSQTAYGLIHSVDMSSRLDLGNINRIGTSIIASFDWFSRRSQFDSSVEHHSYKKDDFRLDDTEVEKLVVNLKANLLSNLLVSLSTLADELLSSIMVEKGKEPSKLPYLRSKTLKVTCTPDQEWARRGVLELNVIRNCFVHNDGKWSERGLQDIAPLVKNLVANDGEPLEVNFEDVFRYKRAVRTLLNQAHVNGFAPDL